MYEQPDTKLSQHWVQSELRGEDKITEEINHEISAPSQCQQLSSTIISSKPPMPIFLDMSAQFAAIHSLCFSGRQTPTQFHPNIQLLTIHNCQSAKNEKAQKKKKTKKKLGVSHCYCRSPSPQPLLPPPAKGPATARNLHLHAKPHRIPARARLKLYELPPGGEEAKTKKTQMVGSD